MKVVKKPGGLSEHLQKAIDDLETKRLSVGWFDTAKYEDGTPVAYVATIQEFGYKSIPARPFMRPTISENKVHWAEKLRKGSAQVIKGKLTVEQIYGQFGMLVAGEISATIAKITSPPLSPITLLLRQHRNAGGTVTGKTVGNAAAASGFVPTEGAGKALGVSDKPLVDTGLLIQSVSSKVENV